MEKDQTRLPWTDEEDRILVRLVEDYGDKKWTRIAAEMPGRTGKGCSHRWRTYLRPDVAHPHQTPFTEWEAAVIVESQKDCGNNWRAIAKLLLPGRSNTAVKNFWHSRLKGGSIQAANRFLKARMTLAKLLRDVPEEMKLIALPGGAGIIPPAPGTEEVALPLSIDDEASTHAAVPGGMASSTAPNGISATSSLRRAASLYVQEQLRMAAAGLQRSSSVHAAGSDAPSGGLPSPTSDPVDALRAAVHCGFAALEVSAQPRRLPPGRAASRSRTAAQRAVAAISAMGSDDEDEDGDYMTDSPELAEQHKPQQPQKQPRQHGGKAAWAAPGADAVAECEATQHGHDLMLSSLAGAGMLSDFIPGELPPVMAGYEAQADGRQQVDAVDAAPWLLTAPGHGLTAEGNAATPFHTAARAPQAQGVRVPSLLRTTSHAVTALPPAARALPGLAHAHSTGSMSCWSMGMAASAQPADAPAGVMMQQRPVEQRNVGASNPLAAAQAGQRQGALMPVMHVAPGCLNPPGAFPVTNTFEDSALMRGASSPPPGRPEDPHLFGWEAVHPGTGVATGASLLNRASEGDEMSLPELDELSGLSYGPWDQLLARISGCNGPDEAPHHAAWIN